MYCTYERNIQGRSRNHRCRGKAISITYCEVSVAFAYPVRKAHASYYALICRVPGSTIFFFHIS